MHSSYKVKSLLEIFLIFVFPMILLFFGVIPLEYRLYVGIPVLSTILLIIKTESWSLKKIGIRIDNLKESLIPYVFFTILGVLFLLFLAKILGKNPLSSWWTHPHFQYFFIPVSIFQEFFYRSFLIPKLDSVSPSLVVSIMMNALLFTLLHIIFPNPFLMLPVAFVGGLAFTIMYKLYPNLILISIAHIILNFIAVLYCFFSFSTTC